jgi:cation diffusion facilitator CzcD-associated flavoprotein CzcO
MRLEATSDRRLEQLSAAVRADLGVLRHPVDPWVVPRAHPSGKHVYDVLIIGAGQSGLAIAFALMRDRVSNIVVLDRRLAGREGPWNTTARMRTLRTPKHLPGIELGLPNLTTRAWYIARYGSEAWERLDKIPKEDWQDYLMWCRQTLQLPVRNEAEVTSIRWDDSLFRVAFEAHDGNDVTDDHVYARHVVLATGVEGNGDWQTPEFIKDALPRERYRHAGEAIDFDALKGKSLAVLGAGASAFDNSSTALEHGAKSVVLCIRRKEIQRVNPQLWMGKAGFLRHFADLPDDWKWRFMQHMFNYNIPAPQDAYDRLARLPGAEIRQNAGWKSVRLIDRQSGDQEIEIETAGGTLRADFLITAVGFEVDFHKRRELAAFADQIAQWRDRFPIPLGEERSAVATYPYLGSTFEFVEKRPGAAPYLGRIRNFTYGAMVSMGLSGAAISGLKYAVPRLVHGITRSLFLEDVATHYESFSSYAVPELVGRVPLPQRHLNWENQ